MGLAFASLGRDRRDPKGSEGVEKYFIVWFEGSLLVLGRGEVVGWREKGLGIESSGMG